MLDKIAQYKRMPKGFLITSKLKIVTWYARFQVECELNIKRISIISKSSIELNRFCEVILEFPTEILYKSKIESYWLNT